MKAVAVLSQAFHALTTVVSAMVKAQYGDRVIGEPLPQSDPQGAGGNVSLLCFHGCLIRSIGSYGTWPGSGTIHRYLVTPPHGRQHLSWPGS